LRALRRRRQTGNRESRAESGAGQSPIEDLRLCYQFPEPAVSRGAERFAEPHGAGRFIQSNFRKALDLEQNRSSPTVS